MFVLRNSQLSGSRDGGGSRAAVAAQLAGEPGWDKGRAGPGGGGAGRRLSQPKVEPADSGRWERAAPRAWSEGGALVMEGPVWEPGRSELRVVRHGRDEDRGGAGAGTRKRAPWARAEPTRRLRGRLNPKNGGAALVVAGLVFFLNANPGTTGTAIPACVPGAPHYAWGRVRPAGLLREGIREAEAGEGCEVARGCASRSGAAHHTNSLPFPRKCGLGKTRASSGGSPGLWEPGGDRKAGGGAAEKPSTPPGRHWWPRGRW